MKNLIFIIVLAGLLTSCNRLINPEHDFYISGVLIDNCEQKNPLGGVEVQFDVNGETFASAKTNAYGEFSLSGTAVEKGGKYKNEPVLAVNYTAASHGGYHYKDLALLPFEGAVLDTLYYHGSNRVQVSLETGSLSYTEQDTLFISYSPVDVDPDSIKTSSFGDNYRKKYPGPFTDGPLDIILMQGPPHYKYHDDGSYSVRYWINDRRTWRENPSKEHRTYYAMPGYGQEETGGCHGLTPALLKID